MFGLKSLRRSVRGAINWGTAAVSVVLLTAILGGVGAALSVLAGATAIGAGIAAAALFAGIVEFLTLSHQPNTSGVTSIPVRTLALFTVLAVLVVVEALAGATSYTLTTVVAGLTVGVTYLMTEVVNYVKGSSTPPAPPTA